VLAFEYCGTYLHDVYEDFESGRIERTDAGYRIGGNSPMLADFIGREELSGDLKRLTDGMDDDRRLLADRGNDLEQMFAGTFGDPGFPLRRTVAEACFRLSLDLIRHEAIPTADLEARPR